MFHLKSSFLSQDIQILCFELLVMQKNGLTRKIRLVSKFLTPQLGRQTTAIHILPNISRSKGNPTMKFGRLIEHDMRNIFLEKSFAKCCGETISKNFPEK